MNDSTRISCEICRDLLPLVKDGVAGADSTDAVSRHLEACAECRGLAEQPLPAEMPQKKKTIRKAEIWLRGVYTVLMIFGIYFGLSLTDAQDTFNNSLIMPAVGILGYVLLRNRAFLAVPLLIFVTHLIVWAFSMFPYTTDFTFADMAMWSVIYSFFALLGTLAAAFLHFGFRKEDAR